MKKYLALLLMLVMVTTLLVGCGGGEKTSTPDNDVSTEDSSGQDTKKPDKSAEDDKGEVEETTLTLLIDKDISIAGIQAVTDLAKEKLGITIEFETRPGGAEGDNIVKTRLAAGEMADLCLYNSGSLLNALNPAEYFIDISNEDFIDKLDETYKSTVTVDGVTYGIPVSSTQAGAILYNKPLYEKYNLEVPSTWDEFIANCNVLKEAGEVAIIGSYADSWTSQVMFLGDNYNVLSQVPNFAEEFEAGKAKYATTPAALASFEKLEQTHEYHNADYLAATYDDACNMIANGEGAHWVILTQALSNIYELYEDKINDIGVFGIPSDDPEDHGLTVWMPSSLYGNKQSDKQDAILKFMEFYVSDEALDAYTSVILPDGPYAIKGYALPDNAYPAVAEDMQAYFDAGKTEVALEFLTAVKGANAPNICAELGSGQTTALEAAEAYDADCLKQAIQLGLDWE